MEPSLSNLWPTSFHYIFTFFPSVLDVTSEKEHFPHQQVTEVRQRRDCVQGFPFDRHSVQRKGDWKQRRTGNIWI
jgi:hypothetical protein